MSVPLSNQPLRTEAPTHKVPPCNEARHGEFLIRNEVGDMVKQLHQLRRRLAQIEGDLAQEAVEAIIKACFELDQFLRSPGTPPNDAGATNSAIRPRTDSQLTPRQAALARLERAHKEKEGLTDRKDGNAFADSR